MALTITVNDSWELGSRSGKKKLQVKDVTVVGDGVELTIAPSDVGLTTFVACTPASTSVYTCIVSGSSILHTNGTGPVPFDNGLSMRLLIFGLE